MISARWVITAALLLGVIAAAIGYARYTSTRPSSRPRPPSTVRSPALNPFRCDPEHVVDDTTPPEVRAIESQLYEQIVRSRYREKVPLIVEDISIPVPTHTDGPQDAEFFDSLPRELASWVLSTERRTECSDQTLDRFPAGTILIPEDRVVRNARPQRVPNIDWTRFQERFPGAKALFAFSRAKVTSNGLDALLYYDRFCPNNCGEGEYVWFHRASATDSWHLAKEQWLWIS